MQEDDIILKGMEMESGRINSEAWDWEAENSSAWAKIVSEDEIKKAVSGHPSIRVTIEKNVPDEWVAPLKGKHVLSLAGGGGQQTPILSAFGCETECLDISPVMIERDKEALKRYSLDAKLHIGDMRDLSIFADGSFDGIINPVSMNFVDDIGKVFSECRRILRIGGSFIFGIANPVLYIFDDRLLAKGKMKVKYTLPFSDEKSLSEKELKKRIAHHDTVEYSHTLNTILGKLCRSGFAIVDFFSDVSSFEPIDSFLQDCYLAVRAIRIDDRTIC